MGSLAPDFLRAIAVGVTIHLLILNAWLARRRASNGWLAGWAAIALVSGSARLIQIRSDDPEIALLAVRLFVASAPLQIWTLVSAVRARVGRPLRGARALAFAAFNLAWAAAFFATPWFIAPSLQTVHEFGRSFLGGVAGPAMGALGAYVLAAVAWTVSTLARSEIDRRERVGGSLALGGYGALALLSVLSALDVVELPVLADVGTIVLALGFSYTLSVRQNALEEGLEQLVERRTQRIAAGEKLFRELFENAPLGFVVCDATGQVTMVNAHMWRVLGAPEPLPASQLGNILTHSSAIRGGGAAVARRALENGETSVAEAFYDSVWGGSRTLRVIAAPTRGASGKILGAVLLVEDVTERKAVQQHLRDSQKLEAMGRLAAGIAHEVNNPLACLRANLAVVREDLPFVREAGGAPREGREPPPSLDELAKILDESAEEVERAIAIVRDMREFAHASSARGESFEATDLRPLLRNCVRVASTQARTVARVEERYEPLRPVRGSASQLRQVFLNLLVNAVQAAGDRGSVSVSAAVEGEHVVVRVSDDGPGIAPDQRVRLFQPFYTTKPAGQGTGLGLYISREIVHAHGGEIRIHSTPGEGATFEVRLPVEP